MGWVFYTRYTADEEWWPRRFAADGSTVETHDPGLGLLAQHEVWILAPAGSETPQEG
jgi:hypothetical protein